ADTSCVSFFVFQAEDGIRDWSVTGVQTCALPIYGRHLAACEEGVVRVWDWEHRQPVHALPGHEYHSIPVAFRPDGRHLATGGSRSEERRVGEEGRCRWWAEECNIE